MRGGWSQIRRQQIKCWTPPIIIKAQSTCKFHHINDVNESRLLLGKNLWHNLSPYRLVFYMFFHGRGADLDTVSFQLISVKDINIFYSVLHFMWSCTMYIDLERMHIDLERMLEFFKDTTYNSHTHLSIWQFLSSVLIFNILYLLFFSYWFYGKPIVWNKFIVQISLTDSGISQNFSSG